MNYIGSKLSLLDHIKKILLKNNIPLHGVALDLFSGTSVVAQLLKTLGYQTHANDWQHFSYLLSSSYICPNVLPEFQKIVSKIPHSNSQHISAYSAFSKTNLKPDSPSYQVLNYLNQLPGSPGLFFDHYAEGGKENRKYFCQYNGQKIQAIRDQIQSWHEKKEITDQEKNWLTACLIEAADKVANTASIYGAFLKKIKRPAQKELFLHALNPITSKTQGHRSSCLDSLKLLKEFGTTPITLTYIDPPYNHRQYCSNYHILETIARWDLGQFTPKGVTGQRDNRAQKSVFCYRTKAFKAFSELFKNIKSDYVLFSYSNEGLLTQEQITYIISQNFKILDFQKIRYQRFRADLDHPKRKYQANSTTKEFLILAQKC